MGQTAPLKGIDPRSFDNLITDYTNAGDMIGRFGVQLGKTKLLRSTLGETDIRDVMTAVMVMRDPFLLNTILNGAASAINNPLNFFLGGIPLATHSMDTMIKDGRLVAEAENTNTDEVQKIVGHIAKGTKIVADGGTFAIVTIGDAVGGILWYAGEGVVRFLNTSAYAIDQLTYYGTDGVLRFIDTSKFLILTGTYCLLDLGTELMIDIEAGLPQITDDMNSFMRSAFGHSLFNILSQFATATTAPARVDPLILDLDGDGAIDASDSIYTSLRVWRDANRDGKSVANELKSLAETGIQSISLSSTISNITDVMGNIQHRLGSFTFTDGRQGAVGEYLLNRSPKNSIEVNTPVTISTEIMALPEIAGTGNVSSLRNAMARDTSGQLTAVVKSFTLESLVENRNQQIDEIIYRWTGAHSLDPASRGPNVDARQLVALERFFGTGFIGTNGTSPHAQAGIILKHAYADLRERIYADILGQSRYASLKTETQVKNT